MKTCRACKAEMTITREDRPHRDVPGVTLVGLEVRRCPQCSAYEIAIPALGPLHRLICAKLLEKNAGLGPEEVRFLRDSMGWSDVELARHLGVSAGSVSRWEQGEEPIGPVADRLVRMLASVQLALDASPIDALTDIVEGVAPLRLALRHGPAGWDVVRDNDPVATWAGAPPDARRAILAALAPENFVGASEMARVAAAARDVLGALT